MQQKIIIIIIKHECFIIILCPLMTATNDSLQHIPTARAGVENNRKRTHTHIHGSKRMKDKLQPEIPTANRDRIADAR